MDADLFDNSTEGSATPDRGGSILHGSQRLDHQDATANKGVCVLYIPGDLEDIRQNRGATAGTLGKRTGSQVGTY